MGNAEGKSLEREAVVKKKIPLWVYVAAGVVVLLVGFVAWFMTRDTGNFVSMTEKLLAKQKGYFRYVLDVRTSKHEDATSQEDVANIADLENMEADKDVDKILEDYLQGGTELSDWTNSEGTSQVDWEYPMYKVIAEGNVVSTEPLEMDLKISIATNYFNDAFTDIVVKNGKTYVNVEQLRYWLASSKDKTLVALSQDIPESAKYVSYEGDAFNLYSMFAEDAEKDLSRESSIVNMYNRMLVTEKVAVSSLAVDKGCFRKENDIYRVDISGENAVALLKSVKSLLANIGDRYRSVVESQKANNLLTEEKYAQALRETDNVMDAYSGLAEFLTMADLPSLNLNVSGNAREYESGKGSTILESALAMQFVSGGTDYSIALQMHKDEIANEVREPMETTVDISKYKDQDFIQKYLVQVIDHFNITGVPVWNRLEASPENAFEKALADLVDVVNEAGRGMEGYYKVDRSGIMQFIDKYRNYTSKETDTIDAVNAVIVKDFLDKFSELAVKVESEEDLNASVTDETRFPSLVADTEKFRIYADFDRNTSNTKLVSVKMYILNKSAEELALKASDFELKTMIGNKYPANNETVLRDYDNTFDMAKAPEEFKVAAQGYIECQMYFVLASGIEYMDLDYMGAKLGPVIAR